MQKLPPNSHRTAHAAPLLSGRSRAPLCCPSLPACVWTSSSLGLLSCWQVDRWNVLSFDYCNIASCAAAFGHLKLLLLDDFRVVGLLPCAVEVGHLMHCGCQIGGGSRWAMAPSRTLDGVRRWVAVDEDDRWVGSRCSSARMVWLELADGRVLLVAARMEHGGAAGRRLLGVMQICDGWRDGGRCCGDRSKEPDGGGDVGRQDRSWLQEGAMGLAGASSWSGTELLEHRHRICRWVLLMGKMETGRWRVRRLEGTVGVDGAWASGCWRWRWRAGSGVGMLDGVMEWVEAWSDQRDLVVAVVSWGPDHRIGGWPEMRRTAMAAIPNEDDGAPNPVLRWCTQICVPANVDFTF
ncbi:hypothetical protein ACLOJK_014359 [Asimina triloba]